MGDDLFPCPFCGEEPIEQTSDRWPDWASPNCVTGYVVVCDNDECPIYHARETYYLTKEEAAKAWNTRVGYDPIQAQIDSFMVDLKKSCGL